MTAMSLLVHRPLKDEISLTSHLGVEKREEGGTFDEGNMIVLIK
jgi:hypothetical protein